MVFILLTVGALNWQRPKGGVLLECLLLGLCWLSTLARPQGSPSSGCQGPTGGTFSRQPSKRVDLEAASSTLKISTSISLIRRSPYTRFVCDRQNILQARWVKSTSRPIVKQFTGKRPRNIRKPGCSGCGSRRLDYLSAPNSER